MDQQPRFKASVMTSTLAFISRELGEPALPSILGSFDSREIDDNRLLPSDWQSLRERPAPKSTSASSPCRAGRTSKKERQWAKSLK